MKPIDVKSNCYAEGNVESNEKDPQFEVSGHVRNTKKFLLNDILNWSEEVFVIKKIKNTFPWMLLVIKMVKTLLNVFTKKIAEDKSNGILN